MKFVRLLPAAAFLFVACATSTPPPKTVPAATATPAPTLDAVEFRRHLEDAYSEIVKRETHAVPTPTADVEAAASIPIPEHRTINGAVDLFSKRMHDDIQTSLIRSARFKPVIDKALEEHELPKGLAYLPVIESAYMTTLTSSAGAHGVWQFMPETAREYGLRVDWWIDERADFEKSTRAAASYLRDLHRQFDDWSLALAAYNCGPGRVKRALSTTGATTFWELLEMSALPKETRGYVPTFYATLIIASDPETYGFRLSDDPGSLPQTHRVEVEGPVSLRYLAEVAGISESQLKELNPELRRGVVPPDGAWVRLPMEAVTQIASRVRSLKDEDEYLTYTSFKVRKGDTLKSLARAIGTEAETIAAMNATAALRAGSTIYLPVRARELGTLLRHSEDRDVFYTVRKGDTVYSIAKRHKLTVAELRELNSLSKDATLKPGKKLRVGAGRGLTAGGM